jgi:lysylphosphatidylglycerol synthetase-like protein (DUF2156 family)
MHLNGGATQLTVTGTSDCQTLVVWLPSFSQQVTVPVVGGNWTATFTSANAELEKLRTECGKSVKIDAFCKEDENCRRDFAHVLTCGDDPPPRDHCCTMICCMVFKLLFLLGLGFGVLGWIFKLCPVGVCDIEHVIYGLRIWGVVMALIGLLFWVVLCRPKKCAWIAALWQFLVLWGLMMIYVGFCPECMRSLLLYYGLGIFILGLALYFWWRRACDVNICQRLSEWAGLFLIPVNVLLALMFILATCATAAKTGPYILIGLALLFELWLLAMLRKHKCIKC